MRGARLFTALCALGLAGLAILQGQPVEFLLAMIWAQLIMDGEGKA